MGDRDSGGHVCPPHFPMQRSPEMLFSGFSIDLLENARALFYRWSRLRSLISKGSGPTAEEPRKIRSTFARVL